MGIGRGWVLPAAATRHIAHHVSRRFAKRRLTPIPEAVGRHYAELSGLAPDEQQLRCGRLWREHGISPIDAYRYGLLTDDESSRWTQFVYRHETGWNTAAAVLIAGAAGLPSGRIRTSQRVLSDKELTADFLGQRDIPIARGEVIPRRSPPPAIASRLEDALARWHGAVFVKPRRGSGGAGAFRVTGEPGRWTACRYPLHGDAAPDAFAELVNVARRTDMLLQPLLVSLDGDAPLPDTLNLRIVTRDVGGGPEIFSTVAEIPFLRADGIVGYAPVRTDGPVLTGEDAAESPWLPPRIGPRRRATAQRWAGRTLPDVTQSENYAVTAHEAFLGVFAVAWDVALTDAGPVFLEGNTGFAPETPQLVGGGLLADLPRLDRTADNLRTRGS